MFFSHAARHTEGRGRRMGRPYSLACRLSHIEVYRWHRLGSHAEFGGPEYGDPRASCTIVVQADRAMRQPPILNLLQVDGSSLSTNPALAAKIVVAHARIVCCSMNYRSGHFATNIELNFSSNLKDLMIAHQRTGWQVGIKRSWA
jgi:hypothetical protein